MYYKIRNIFNLCNVIFFSRQSLEEAETDIESLEVRLEKVQNWLSQIYVHAVKPFTNGCE